VEGNNYPPDGESLKLVTPSADIPISEKQSKVKFKYPLLLAIPIGILLILVVSFGAVLAYFAIESRMVPYKLTSMYAASGKISKEIILEKLTRNSWCTDPLNEPGHPDYDEKKFNTDSTYSSEYHSDIAWGPTIGKWRLEKSKKDYWVIQSTYKSKIGFNGKHISTLPEDLEEVVDKDIIAFNGNKLVMYPENTDFSTYVGIKYYKDCKQVKGSNS
jgi:hypothetical protein